MKKEAGETLRLAANPPQPVVAAMRIITCKIVSSRDFQLNFIAASISRADMRATPNSSLADHLPASREPSRDRGLVASGTPLPGGLRAEHAEGRGKGQKPASFCVLPRVLRAPVWPSASKVADFGGGRARGLSHFVVLLWMTGVCCLVAMAAPDQNPTPTREEVTMIAQKRLKEARDVLKTAPESTEARWQLGRALFDMIAFTPEGKVADQLIKEAITVCRETIAKDPRLPAAHYYLALNLGHLARNKSLGALKLVEEMEKEFKTTLSLDEKFDHAGADRSLGCLYRDTPGWPISVGSKTKARQHLQRAVELAPDYPGNRLALAEAQMKWGEKQALTANVTALREVWPKARSMFEGEKWVGDWLEWNQSWALALSASGGEKTKP